MNYSSLHDSAFSFTDPGQAVNEVNCLLNTRNDTKNERIREKFVSVLKKNNGFTRLRLF